MGRRHDLAADAKKRDADAVEHARHRGVDVGLQVVHERGFAGASVRDIVQAAGVPQGSFTNHFGSKEALWYATVDWAFQPLVLRLATAFDPTVTDPLGHLVDLLTDLNAVAIPDATTTLAELHAIHAYIRNNRVGGSAQGLPRSQMNTINQLIQRLEAIEALRLHDAFGGGQ